MSQEQTAHSTILIADDEPIVLNLARTILKRSGYRVLAAEDGSRALDLYRQNGKVDLILTDVVMPRTSGPQLVKSIHETDPDVRCVYMSGYSAEQIRQQGAELTCQYLRKPFTPDALLKTVKQALEAA